MSPHPIIAYIGTSLLLPCYPPCYTTTTSLPFTFESIVYGRQFALESIVISEIIAIPDDTMPMQTSSTASPATTSGATTPVEEILPIVSESNTPPNTSSPPPSKKGHMLISEGLLERLIEAASKSSSKPSASSYHGRPPAPPKYYGGSGELSEYLMLLEQHFETYPEHFSKEARKINHAIQGLGTWAEHPDPKLAKLTEQQNPITWATVQLENGVKYATYEAFKEAIKSQFGDDKAAFHAYRESLLSFAMLKGEGVRQYEARLKALWMRATVVFDDEADVTNHNSAEYMLYMNAYCGMHPWIRKAIAPLVPRKTKIFPSIKELFYVAASAEVLPSDTYTAEATMTTKTTTAAATTPQGEKPRNKKRRFGGGEHTGATTTVPYHNKKQKTIGAPPSDNRPRAPWVPMEVYKSRLQKGDCTRCGRTGHHGSECRTYKAAARPTTTTNAPTSSSIKMIEASKK